MKISDLVLDSNNANLGTERGRKALAESLKNYGAGRSILVDRKGRVIAGNKTLEQAVAAGHKDVIIIKSDGKKLVAIQRTDLDLAKDPKAKGLAIADNRVAELDLNWNPEVLQSLVKDVDLTTFWDADELETLLGTSGGGSSVPEAKIDQAAALLKKWGVKAGQIWLIGPHRVLCGDSTNEGDIARLMAGKRAKMAFTNPPWNVGIGGDNNPKHRQRKGLEGDDVNSSHFKAFLEGVSRQLVRQVDGDVYCVLGASEWPTLDGALREAGLHWSSTIIWAKDSFVLGRGKYHQRYEPIWYGWLKKSSFCGGRSQDNVWNFPRPKKSEEHPTMKPPELVARAIRNSSRRNDLVLDLFLGSGTTMAAAEQNGRACYGADIDPAYVAVTLDRMSQMGLKPQLAA
jgi:DNA modification methylase